ncbi:hypothetical protein BD310DRAFT_1029840 [Dichomitus squalens]|uniref:Major facilitator superfamily domain-containing protein n=1 Tax=Dichomitus squalens TaxID=114155 RepID=A0A4Q9Q5T9_9APHY|nr:hypothetical protein BD310DRAFT_1029840 [Dichomitus squalens]
MPLCWCLCINRWNDATTGPKLPRIQERDHFGFVKMSLLICFSDASGFLSGAMASIYLTERFGFGKILSALLQIGAYAMLVPAGPFPVICIVYCIIGFTLAIQAAQTTVFVVSLKKKFAAKMELLHGIYGLGALVSPLVATQSSGSPRFWSHHFITSVGLACTRHQRCSSLSCAIHMEDEGETGNDADDSRSDKFMYMMRLKGVHFLSFFALICVGVEAMLGGWSVTYILEKRGGSLNPGVISSGFFGVFILHTGIILGRVLLLWLNKNLVGRLTPVLPHSLEGTICLIPSLIENAVAVSVVGLLLGPMFPILTNLPKWLMTGCAYNIAGVGQASSAVLPFLTGVLASKFEPS